jgi:hypothetical protein
MGKIRIRQSLVDPVRFDHGSGIRDKHSGSATLGKTRCGAKRTYQFKCLLKESAVVTGTRTISDPDFTKCQWLCVSVPDPDPWICTTPDYGSE